MHLDVLAGVDALIQRGHRRSRSAGRDGLERGRHLVNKLITITDRFKAASSAAGVANWISLFAQTDMRAYRTHVVRRHAVAEERAASICFWNNSPLKDVANVKTPTLFFVGENDTRVPMPQSVEMYRALKSNGVPTQPVRRAARRASVGRAAASALQGQRRARVVRAVRDGPHVRLGEGAARTPSGAAYSAELCH